MNELERTALSALIKQRQWWGTQEPRDGDLQMVRAVLKVHTERLCNKITSMDQDNAASSVTVYFDEPEHSSEFFETLSALQQEDQHHD